MDSGHRSGEVLLWFAVLHASRLVDMSLSRKTLEEAGDRRECGPRCWMKVCRSEDTDFVKVWDEHSDERVVFFYSNKTNAVIAR